MTSRHEYRVKPSSADINENILSEQCRDQYKLSEDDVKSAKSLDHVLRQFDIEVAQATLGGERNFTLVSQPFVSATSPYLVQGTL